MAAPARHRVSYVIPPPQPGSAGWGDDWHDDGEDDTENEPSVGTDGGVLGDVTASVRKRRKSSAASNREEHWELDPGEVIPGQVSTPLSSPVATRSSNGSLLAFGIPTMRAVTLGSYSA